MKSTNVPSRTASVLAWLRTWAFTVAAALAFAVVAGVTGYISYLHIQELTLVLHQPPKVARIMPFGVDGLIVVGSIALLKPPKEQPWLGWVCVGPGAVVSVFANVESSVQHGAKSAAWAGVASVAFILATFALERWLKGQAGGPVATVAETVTVTVGCGHGVADSRDGRILDAWSHIRDCLGGVPTYRGIGSMLGAHNETVRQVVTTLAPDGTDEPETGEAPELIRYASLNGSNSHD